MRPCIKETAVYAASRIAKGHICGGHALTGGNHAAAAYMFFNAHLYLNGAARNGERLSGFPSALPIR
jgi:hypothetical protein